MKKYFAFVVLMFVICFLFISCETMDFDRNLLQASGVSVEKRLPTLEIKRAENTAQIGGQNQVSVSSYIFTIFEREIERNVIVSDGENKGSIEMNLVYSDFNAHPGWSSKYTASMEFEIIIRNLNGDKIWKKAYSGSYKGEDAGLGWTFSIDYNVQSTGYAILEHQLLEEFKNDINKEYDIILLSLE